MLEATSLFLLADAATPSVNVWHQFVLRAYEFVPWLWLLVGMMGLDYLSGIAAAIVEKKLSSKIGFVGAMKKGATLLVVGAAVIAEQSAKSQLPEAMRQGFVIPLAPLAATFFLFNEALSVLENARRCGAPLPNFLTKSFSDTLNRLSTPGAKPGVETATLEIKSAKIEATVTHDGDSGILKQ